jgi:hypothetical protein
MSSPQTNVRKPAGLVTPRLHPDACGLPERRTLGLRQEMEQVLRR